MYSKGHEPYEEVLTNVPDCLRGHLHAHEAVWRQSQRATVTNAMLEVYAQLSMEPGEGEEDAGDDEVIPGGECVATVEEQKDHENKRRHEVGELEPLVADGTTQESVLRCQR